MNWKNAGNFGPLGSQPSWGQRARRYAVRCGLLGTLVLAGSSPALAGLIAADSFLTGNPADSAAGEYSVTQLRRSEANGAGQSPTVTGFVGPWTGNVTSGTLAVAQWTAESAPTGTLIGYQEGGRARFGGASATNALQRRVQRELAPYDASDVYYFSLITQIATGDAAGDPGFVGVGFTNVGGSVAETDANLVGGSALRGLLIGAASTDGATTDFVVRHVGSSGVVQNDVLESNIASVIPTHTIVRLDFNDDPSHPEGNSKLTIWHNPPHYATEAAATASAAPLELRTFAMSAANDLTHLTFTGINYSKAASFDELRFGTTWEAVAPVPEPHAVTLSGLAIGLASGAARRRRRAR